MRHEHVCFRSPYWKGFFFLGLGLYSGLDGRGQIKSLKLNSIRKKKNEKNIKVLSVLSSKHYLYYYIAIFLTYFYVLSFPILPLSSLHFIFTLRFISCLELYLVSAGKLAIWIGFPCFRMYLICVYEDQLAMDQFSMMILFLSHKRLHTVIFKCLVTIAKVVSITAGFISYGSGGRSNPGA